MVQQFPAADPTPISFQWENLGWLDCTDFDRRRCFPPRHSNTRLTQSPIRSFRDSRRLSETISAKLNGFPPTRWNQDGYPKFTKHLKFTDWFTQTIISIRLTAITGNRSSRCLLLQLRRDLPWSLVFYSGSFSRVFENHETMPASLEIQLLTASCKADD